MSERMTGTWAAITVAGVLAAACGGAPSVGVGVGPDDRADPPGSPAGSSTGLPVGCSFVEAQDGGGPGDTASGAVIAANIDRDVDRGPLVATGAATADGSATVIASTLFDENGAPGDVAVWVVSGDPSVVTAANDLAADLTPFDAEPVDTAGTDPVAEAVAIATDCSWVAADDSRPDRPEPAPEMRPDLLVADPGSPRPGERVELRFPEETFRGLAFDLDRRTDTGWETRYWLTSDANGGEPDWARVGSGSFAVNDVGIAGPGPDTIVIPDEAEPGEYRVCTGNAGEDFCTELEIAG